VSITAAETPNAFQCAGHLPKIAPFCGGSGPHLTHAFLGPPESTSKRHLWSVQPFLQSTSVWPADTHRPTDHAMCGSM